MNREQLREYIIDYYNVKSDFPWSTSPQNEVFRHENNKKWFALIMDISKDKLGLNGKDIISIVNLKCDPVMIGSLIGEKGIFPAYHMNKENWVSIALDGSADDEKIKMLVDISFELTDIKL